MRGNIVYYIYILLLTFIGCDSDKQKPDMELDLGAPEEAVIRYEVNMDQPKLFYLSVSYTDGQTFYDFEQKQFINRERLKDESKLDTSYWSYEAKVKRGAILYIGADVTSKENISASEPAEITLKIYINNILVKEEKGMIHAITEYIYGIKYQNSDFNIYIQIVNNIIDNLSFG